MGIRPINDDHAIELVSFSLSLDKNVGELIGERMSSQARVLMEDLPAVALPRSYNREMQPEPHTPPYSGIEFSRFRPNGSAAWIARIVGFEIAIECTRYTRWQNVWGQARSYLTTVMEAIATSEMEVNVTSVMMNVRDAFVADEQTPTAAAIAPTEVLAMPALNSDSFWHLHQGWIASKPHGSQLNRLNLASLGHSDILGFGVEDAYRLVVDHVMKMTLANPIALQSSLGIINDVIEGMHVDNKASLKWLLKHDLQARIGLIREEGSNVF